MSLSGLRLFRKEAEGDSMRERIVGFVREPARSRDGLGVSLQSPMQRQWTTMRCGR